MSFLSRSFYSRPVRRIRERTVLHQFQRHYVVQPFFILEAFIVGNRGYTGNPAGVCMLQHDDDISDETKQKIANSLNLSVTAFVGRDWKKSETLLLNNSPDDLKTLKRTLRWFTPIKEIFLCGHATLASAFSLVQSEKSPVEKIEFYSKARGILSATIENDLVNLHFPANSTVKVFFEESWLLGFTRIILGPNFNLDSTTLETVLQDVQYCHKESILLLRLKRNSHEDPIETIRKVYPNFEMLLRADTGQLKMQGFIVTIEGESNNERKSRERDEPNFYSRYFAPHIGLNEDVATGVSHTILTGYWTKELGFGGQILKSHQASGRGGDLQCILQGEQVRLAGRARILVQGELYL